MIYSLLFHMLILLKNISHIIHILFFTIVDLLSLNLNVSFILSFLILSYLILSYLILSYLILSYLSLSYLIFYFLCLPSSESYLILWYIILSYLVLSYLILGGLEVYLEGLGSVPWEAWKCTLGGLEMYLGVHLRGLEMYLVRLGQILANRV